MASKAPAMGKLQDKIERMEMLRPRIDQSIRDINSILEPIPFAPEPLPRPKPIYYPVYCCPTCEC